jgi:hypothetical protein
LLNNRNAIDASKGTSWQITYGGRLVYNISGAELNDIYGGYVSGHGGIPPTDCGGIIVTPNSFGLIVGHDGDLLMAFGIERSADGIKGVKILRYYAHDFGMSSAPAAAGDQMLLNYGWKHDLWARFCWNTSGNSEWWHNANHRAGAGACVNGQWPCEYLTTNVQEIQVKTAVLVHRKRSHKKRHRS